MSQDRPPNFREGGRLYLVRCFECNQENYGPAVATGKCAWCGWKENDPQTLSWWDRVVITSKGKR